MTGLAHITTYIPTPIKKRLPQSAGLASLFLAVFVLMALASYDSGDPSLNRASSSDIRNLMGAPGAIVSDLALQLFGLVSGLIVLTLGGWGWRLLREKHISHFSFRVCALLMAIVASASALYSLPTPGSWPFGSGLGGNMGHVVASQLDSIAPPWLVILASLALALPCLLFAVAIRGEEWAMVVQRVRHGLSRALDGVTHIYGLLSRESLRTAPQSYNATPRRGKPAPGAEQQEAADAQSAKSRPTAPVKRKTPANKEKQGAFELRQKRGDFEFPAVSLLTAPPKHQGRSITDEALQQNATMLESVLKDFGVKGEIVNIRPGPVVTLYELEPAPGTKSSRVIGLADDIARSMSSVSARISVIPGRNAIGIELPNTTRQTVYLRENLEHDSFTSTKSSLPMVLGKNIGGEAVVVDLAKMPHLLVAGTTGSGKSVAINTMIVSLLYHHSPETCKFIMIDPKMLELSVYNDIPHLLTPVVTDPGKAVVALKWTVKEMEHRYQLMAGLGVRNVDNYNKRIQQAQRTGEELKREVQTGFDPETGQPIYEQQTLDMKPLPYIVVVVDEMADLMLVAGKDIEGSIQRLAQMARAAGIHLIMATQRPSVDVITGVIKANFPTRISFQVTSKIDSRTILGEQGAEQLLGQGDMLYMAGGSRISRVHGPFISDSEVEEVVAHLKRQSPPEYIEDVTKPEEEQEAGEAGDGEESEAERELYDRAVAVVARDRKASTSYVQRCLKIGYNRAARIIERMERDGVVSAANHVGKREVLAPEPPE